eukprot:525696_1
MDQVMLIYSQINDNDKDIVLLSAMMEAYYHNNWNKQCLKLFKNINTINNKIKPDTVCYAIALKTCTQCTAYHFGKTIHNELKNNEYLSWILNETEIQINLIELYGKCGYLNICKDIFNNIKLNQNNKYLSEINLWNAMIHSFGRNGLLSDAFEYYKLMDIDGVNKDKNTFILIISACSHSGDLEKAKYIYENDICDNKIKYDSYLISSLVDCYSRIGYLNDAKELILEYEIYSNNNYYEGMWTSLMSGCIKYNNEILAEEIHNEINKRFDINKQGRHLASTSIMLANIYGINNNFSKQNEIRNKMKQKGLDKYQRTAMSEIDINGEIHTFIAGDHYKKNDKYKYIDKKLNEILHKLSKEPFKYIPNISLITREMNKFKNETKKKKSKRKKIK